MRIDIVILTLQSGMPKVQLVKRKIEPFVSQFTIPGGIIHDDENLDERG